MTGTIVRLVRDRGFGFIAVGGYEDIFFHRSALENAVFEHLREGRTVELEIMNSAKGPRAASVQVID